MLSSSLWGSVPVFGAGSVAPAVAAGVESGAVVVAVGVWEDVAVAEDDPCCSCFLFLRRAQSAFRPFLTWDAASGAKQEDSQWDAACFLRTKLSW